MRKFSFYFGIFAVFFFLQCRRVIKDSFTNDENTPYRCGIFTSFIFEDSTEKEIYPDLGLILANAHSLQLSDSELLYLEKKAIECYQICEIQKEEIRLLEENLRQKIKKNGGNLEMLADEVQKIETAKTYWLEHHAARYHEALKSLNLQNIGIILKMEKSLKAFRPLGSY